MVPLQPADTIHSRKSKAGVVLNPEPGKKNRPQRHVLRQKGAKTLPHRRLAGFPWL